MAFSGWEQQPHKAQTDVIAESQADAQSRFDEIVQLLVASGYFRARISGLSPFDKVVGGLAWCLTAISVDIDLAFKENASIGEKIRIGEAVERALRKLKCRVTLQAHQIQGLDYAAIFPVVQFLVKQVYSVRQEIASGMRHLTLAHAAEFAPEPSAAAEAMPLSLRAARQLASGYTPSRRFRPRAHQQPSSAAEHSYRVMLEFGVRAPPSHGGLEGAALAADARDHHSSGGDGSAARMTQEHVTSGAAASEMADAPAGADLSQSRIGKLVSLGATDIQKAASLFAEKTEALLASGEMAQVRRLRAECSEAEREAQVERLVLAEELQRQQALADSLPGLEASLLAAQQEAAEVTQRQERLAAEAAELHSQADAAPEARMKSLQGLIEEHSRLKQQQAAFKRECAVELERLKSARDAQAGTDYGETEAKARELDQLLEVEVERAANARREVAHKSREVGSLQRRMDEQPSRAELMQYERRYRELYRQLGTKSEETKKYYTLFNRLEEKKGYLLKEVSLINSIHENYLKAGAGPKDKLVDSVEGLVKSVQNNLERVQQKLSMEMQSKEALQQRYDKHVERQRKYFKLVKEFQAECQRIEELT